MNGTGEKSRRYPLRITLSTIIVGLLALTVGGTVGIILAVRTRNLETTSRMIQQEVSQRIASKLRDRFEHAEDLLREHLESGGRGLLPVDDLEVFSDYLAQRVRHDDRHEWFAFLQPDGRGCAAVRDPDGGIVLHHTRPVDGRFELLTQMLNEDGTRASTKTASGEGTDFRKTPWYTLGAASTEPAWTKRYVRAIDGTYGWACTASFDRDGRRVGTFGVGFGLEFLEDFLSELSVAKTGRVFLLNPLTGEVRAGPATQEGAELAAVVDRAVARLPQGVKALTVGEMVSVRVRHEGTAHVVALQAQRLRVDAAWIEALVIPESEIVGFATRYLAIGLLAVGGLFVVGLILTGQISKRVASPLKFISRDLERVGEFEISQEPLPISSIEEIAVVSDSAERMKASLRSFGRYVPTGLVRELLREGEEACLGGRLKELTLFFSDVEGFTSISERMAPQSLVDVLGEYLDVVTTVIAKKHGVIDKYIGDGILAFFNAPHDDADHVVHACGCALSVQEGLASRRSEWASFGKPPFRTRIGLHTDDVVVGNIGTPERFSYTVIGDGVNLAARLESLNKAYGTWILGSEKTRRITGDRFEWRRMDLTAVKGREQGEFVYELLGERGKVTDPILDARDRYEAALAAYLERRFEEAVSGFIQAARIREQDKASGLMRERAEMYLKTPPPEGWQGIFVQTQK